MVRKMNKFKEIFDQSKLPDILYHYTTLSAFKGIIETGKLWATDYRYLNDIDEVIHLFKDILPQITGKPIDISKSNPLNELQEIKILKPILIASFSEQNDDISMWGRYTNDDGLNIGFSKNDILNCVLSEDPTQHLYIGKCLYYKKDKVKVVKRIMRNYKPGDNFLHILSALLLIAPFLKNPSFAHEQEWRVIAEYSPNSRKGYGKPCFRIKDNSLIPYGNFDVFQLLNPEHNKTLSIPIITLSPRFKRVQNADKMIEYFIASNNYTLDKLAVSSSSLV